MIIAHDLGTTGNKATLVDADGSMVASVTVPYGTDFGPGGKAEQNPQDWWDALVGATRELLARQSVAPGAIEAISFSGQMMGAVLVDAAGEPVRPAIIWADTRSQAQARRLDETVGMERCYAITGHRINPTYSLSKVMWVRDTEPNTFSRAATMLLAKDYMVLKLTGERLTDPSDASSTNAFDQTSGTWSTEMLDASGLPTSLFPEIRPSTAVAGNLTDQAARDLGLTTRTRVVIGGGDGPMAALGSGIVDADSGAYTYLGSSSWVSFASDSPLHDPQMRTMTFNHVVPDRFVPTATMQAGGASLQWIMDALAPEDPDRYDRLRSMPTTPASSEDLFFLPHLLGERSPYWNPRARAAFVGLARHHDSANMLKAVVEGIGFNLQTGLLAFVENGARISHIDAIGGAAKSADLLQVFADIWGLPVRRRNLVDEATAIGAAIVGGVGVGLFDGFDKASHLSTTTQSFEPDPALHDALVPAHERFVSAYRALEPWFDAATD